MSKEKGNAATFSLGNFSTSNYSLSRPRYPRKLFETILAFHEQEGCGDLALVLDLGCGTGIATAEMVPLARKVIGADPSDAMIRDAKAQVPGADFYVSGADSLPFVEDRSVSMIIAATAAQYFPDSWWKEAARVLKPKGTIALFMYYGTFYPDPEQPHASVLRAGLQPFNRLVGELCEAVNPVSSNLYDTLPLPPEGGRIRLAERIVWNRDGRVDETEAGGRGRLVMERELTLSTFRQLVHTYGVVHRWRTDHPDLCGGPEDPVEQSIEKIKSGTGWNEEVPFKVGPALALLLFRTE